MGPKESVDTQKSKKSESLSKDRKSSKDLDDTLNRSNFIADPQDKFNFPDFISNNPPPMAPKAMSIPSSATISVSSRSRSLQSDNSALSVGGKPVLPSKASKANKDSFEDMSVF